MIKIDHGVEISRIPQNYPDLSYLYRYHDNTGYHVVRFTTTLKPEIGDFIDPVNEILVKREGLQINQDKRMWGTRPDVEVWGR